VEGVSIDGVIAEISKLGVEVSRALSGISEKLVEEVNRLDTVRSAVAIERKELERLHKIDVAVPALDQMVQEYESRKQQLEAEIATQPSVWEENVASSERERKEQEDSEETASTRNRRIRVQEEPGTETGSGQVR